MTKIEVVDKDKKPVIETMSIIELRGDVKNYYDLTVKLDNLRRNPSVIPPDEAEGGAFSTKVSRDIWYAVINATKPLTPKSSSDEKTLARIYKMLFQYTVFGEYPLLQQLCNYLGVNMDEFFGVIASASHPNKEPYTWAYNVFESAAQMNAIRGNGNANARQWIDKSREYKMASEDRVSLAIESQKIDRLKEIGADLAQELIGMSEDED